MNPDGLSPEALTRLRARADGAGVDDPQPDYSDHLAVTRWRASQHQAWGEGTVDGEIEHEPLAIAGVACLRAVPAQADGELSRRPLVVHLHAGGFSLGSPAIDAPITARMAREVEVISVDYRLAPEHPYPAALDDGEAVYRALRNSTDRPIALSGVSAGGSLAIGVAWRCPDVPPAGLALLCPHVDMGVGVARHPVGYEAAYLDGHRPDDPFVSPVIAPSHQLATLPPTLVQTTDAEHMYESISLFVSRADKAGTSLTVQVWQGLWHAWHYHRELPEAHRAVDLATGWLAGLAD